MKGVLFLLMILPLLLLSSCSKEVAGGAALGVGAAGAAYEYQNKRTLDDLEEDYRSGRITQEEYNRRKQEVEGRSLVY